MEARLRYQPGLDGVRALAVAAVLAFHAGHLKGGFLGVSTFFTLSGFLITGLLLSERRSSGRVSLRRFFGRRARRLLPAALLGIVVAGAVTIALHDAQTSHNFRFDALAALGDVANWRFLWSGRAYANLFASESPLLHYWSLALEEQFYLVLAPLIVALLAITRGRRAWLGTALAALATASFVDGWFVVHGSVDRAYYGTDTRALEFLVGALLAVVVSRGPLGRRASRVVACIGPFALAALVGATIVARVSDAALFRGGLLAYAIGSATVVAAACEPGPVRWLCSLDPLRRLGRISYGLYVYHWPVFLWLSPARTHLDTVPLTALRVAVSLAVAIASFVFIEQPIREGRPIVRRVRWVAFPATAALVAATVVVVGVVAPAPAVTFAPTESAAAVLAAAPRIVSRPPTAAAATTVQRAVSAAPVHRVLVVGDSVALTLARGIERWGATRHVAVLNFGLIGCSLMNGAEVRGYWGVQTRKPDPCDTRTNWPRLLNQFHPDLVVVLYGAWDVYDASFDHGRTWHAPGDPQWDAVYARQIRDAAHRLSATGARVLWLTPPCYAPTATASANNQHAPWYDPARVTAVGTVIHGVAATGAMLVSDVVHDAGCPVNFAMRPDGVHYSDPGADAVMKELGPVIVDPGRVSRSSR